MTDLLAKLTTCDAEPIHIPGSIQPHGMMLVLDRIDLSVRQVAGDVEGRLGIANWQGRSLLPLLGDIQMARIGALLRSSAGGGFVGQLQTPVGETLDISARPSGAYVLLELEPAAVGPLPAAIVLDRLEAAAADFERATNLAALCEKAAREFRLVTGFDRVMVYRFLEDGAGRVLAEDKRSDLRSFMNHHFPANDIPRQARALYLRNLIRVIPDVHYRPAPLRPYMATQEALDLSDSALRSVSPIHVQFLKNMGVAASASVSIVKDGELWGLIACHSETPRMLSFDVRSTCCALAGVLSRRIKTNEETDGYRQRIALRQSEDEITALLASESAGGATLSPHLGRLTRMFDADGIAILRADTLRVSGNCPTESAIRALAAWLPSDQDRSIFVTDSLSELYPAALEFREQCSGLLALLFNGPQRSLILWFRAEHVEIINWAGNPHAEMTTNAVGMLTPRASFDAWQSSVRGIARAWTAMEIEAATRLKHILLNIGQTGHIHELNRQLTETLRDKDLLLAQKEWLVSEVNHRVHNSLELVANYLALQAKASASGDVQAELEEAQRHLNTVELVHRPLYRDGELQVLDAARYIEELCIDALASMGPAWQHGLSLALQPITLSTEQAIMLGLILSELILNIHKYAYGGEAGPVEVILAADPPSFQLIVADKGTGTDRSRIGFGTHMMEALAHRLGGRLAYGDNRPGLRAVLTAPVKLE